MSVTSEDQLLMEYAKAVYLSDITSALGKDASGYELVIQSLLQQHREADGYILSHRVTANPARAGIDELYDMLDILWKDYVGIVPTGNRSRLEVAVTHKMVIPVSEFALGQGVTDLQVELLKSARCAPILDAKRAKKYLAERDFNPSTLDPKRWLEKFQG